jgi:hypothetical protein
MSLIQSTTYQRPVTPEGARVTPSDFNSYRNNHDFRAPCCLCASDAPENGYTECAIYIPLEGQYKGEYVAGCAFNRCGYLGEHRIWTHLGLYKANSQPTRLVCIERWYSRRGLLIDQYPRRRKFVFD